MKQIWSKAKAYPETPEEPEDSPGFISTRALYTSSLQLSQLNELDLLYTQIMPYYDESTIPIVKFHYSNQILKLQNQTSKQPEGASPINSLN